MKKAIVVFVLVLVPGVAVAQQPQAGAVEVAGAADVAGATEVAGAAVVARAAPQGGQPAAFFGVRGGLFYEDRVGHGPLVGIEVGIPIGSDRLILNPNAELAVADSYVAALSGDVIFHLTPPSPVQLWVGAGVGYLNESGFFRSSKSGLVGNLLVGAGMGEGRVRPYVQAKAILVGASHFSVAFGVRF